MNDTSLKQAGSAHTWSVSAPLKAYSHFRVIMTAKNSSEHYWNLACSGFELHGFLDPSPQFLLAQAEAFPTGGSGGSSTSGTSGGGVSVSTSISVTSSGRARMAGEGAAAISLWSRDVGDVKVSIINHSTSGSYALSSPSSSPSSASSTLSSPSNGNGNGNGSGNSSLSAASSNSNSNSGASASASSFTAPIVTSAGKTFKFVHDMDTEGVLYWLGRNKGASSVWINPYSLGLVALASSPLKRDSERLSVFIGRTAARGVLDDIEGGWLVSLARSLSYVLRLVQ